MSGTKTETSEESSFKRLPFDHCCLSLQPFKNPYCDVDGNIFELEALIPYLKQYKHNPVTGKPLNAKSLIKLKFHKNAEGQYHCPILFKVFSIHSHIVAIKTTGNVLSYEVKSSFYSEILAALLNFILNFKFKFYPQFLCRLWNN